MRTSALERPEAPLASAVFSSSVTRTPRAARAQVMLAPLTPPPTTTTSAVSTMASELWQDLVAEEGHRADPAGPRLPLVGDDQEDAEAADVPVQGRQPLGHRVGIADQPDVVGQVLDGDGVVRHVGVDLGEGQPIRPPEER